MVAVPAFQGASPARAGNPARIQAEKQMTRVVIFRGFMAVLNRFGVSMSTELRLSGQLDSLPKKQFAFVVGSMALSKNTLDELRIDRGNAPAPKSSSLGTVVLLIVLLAG